MFEFNGCASYALKHQARCLTAVEGDTDHNKFLVASLSLRGSQTWLVTTLLELSTLALSSS